MIPHVGVRVYGTEYFYSDCIESRPVAVMQDMLEDFPQVSSDLGPATVTAPRTHAPAHTHHTRGDNGRAALDTRGHGCARA